MWIDFNKGLTPLEIILLQLIHQNQKEDLNELVRYQLHGSFLETFHEKGLITLIKGKKGDTDAEKARLTKKGRALLEELQTPPVEEQDLKILEWMCAHYLKLGKTIGNKKKTGRHLKDFRHASGIEKNNIIHLFLDFLNDEENMQYNNVLEYALYKAPTAFETRFQLEESRLYKHFIKNRSRIEKKFETYEQ